MAAILICLTSLNEGLAKRGRPSMCENSVAKFVLGNSVSYESV